MAPSDRPGDDDNDYLSGRAPSLDDTPIDRESPYLGGGPEGDMDPFPSPDDYLADINLPLEDIPELDNDLKADTLEFERVSRSSKPNRLGLKLILGVVVLGVGGIAAWAQWGDELFGRNGDELPIVRASEIPLKVRPEKPGGIDIPNRDKLVYDRLEKKPPEEKTENLLPRPEVPLTPPAPKPVDKAEITVQPEEKPELKSETLQKAGTPPTTAEVKAIEKPAPAPTPPKIVTKVEPKVAALSKAPVITAKSYQIQLAAVRTAAAAKTEWTRLQKKHPSLLGKLSLNVVRADLGKKGVFHRLRAGPLTDLTVAKALCSSLAKVKLGCLVIRPGK